jgi:hypothetical protein
MTFAQCPFGSVILELARSAQSSVVFCLQKEVQDKDMSGSQPKTAIYILFLSAAQSIIELIMGLLSLYLIYESIPSRRQSVSQQNLEDLNAFLSKFTNTKSMTSLFRSVQMTSLLQNEQTDKPYPGRFYVQIFAHFCACCSKKHLSLKMSMAPTHECGLLSLCICIEFLMFF